jgi:hypothetical protein
MCVVRWGAYSFYGGRVVDRRTIALLVASCMLAVTGCTGRALQSDSVRSPSAPVTVETDESRTASFDQASWNSTEPGRGHTYAAACALRRDGVLIGKSLQEVGRLLGRFDSSAVPVDYVRVGGSAEVGYDLVEGPTLQIGFDDNEVRTVTVVEHAGPPEESVKLAGTWRVIGNAPLERLKFQPGGGLTRAVRIGDRRRPRYGRWSVLTPGRIVCWRPYLNSDSRRDSVGVYEYKISGDRMTLIWVDTQVDVPWGRPHRGPYRWEPWVGASSVRSLTLQRLE